MLVSASNSPGYRIWTSLLLTRFLHQRPQSQVRRVRRPLKGFLDGCYSPGALAVWNAGSSDCENARCQRQIVSFVLVSIEPKSAPTAARKRNLSLVQQQPQYTLKPV